MLNSCRVDYSLNFIVISIWGEEWSKLNYSWNKFGHNNTIMSDKGLKGAPAGRNDEFFQITRFNLKLLLTNEDTTIVYIIESMSEYSKYESSRYRMTIIKKNSERKPSCQNVKMSKWDMSDNGRHLPYERLSQLVVFVYLAHEEWWTACHTHQKQYSPYLPSW